MDYIYKQLTSQTCAIILLEFIIIQVATLHKRFKIEIILTDKTTTNNQIMLQLRDYSCKTKLHNHTLLIESETIKCMLEIPSALIYIMFIHVLL